MRKILIPIIIIALTLSIVGAGLYVCKKNQNRLSDKAYVEKALLAEYNSKKGYDFSYNQLINTQDKSSKENDANRENLEQKFAGKLVPQGGIEAEYKIGDQVLYDVKRINNETYIKLKDTDWSKNNEMFRYELTILAHPEYIQIQKRLGSVQVDRQTYLQYEIIFENSNQKALEAISPKDLEAIRIYGTILLDPQTFKLKQMSLHQGKNNSTNSFTIYYSPLSQTPIILPPNIN